MRLHDDFDPLCGLTITRNNNDTRKNYSDLYHLQNRFSNEIADRVPTSTLVFINEMYARMPVRSYTQPSHNVFRGSFRTAAEFAKSAGHVKGTSERDETWIALPKIRVGKSSDVEAYSRENFAMKPVAGASWALSTVNEWFVFFCAVNFYYTLAGIPSLKGVQSRSIVLSNAGLALGVPYKDTHHEWNNFNFIEQDLPKARRNTLVQLNTDLNYSVMNKVKEATRMQANSITIEIPDHRDALPGIDRLNAFQPKKMIRKWAERCRTPEDAAMAIMLADDKVLGWT
jgi:hypothetical protein